MAVDASGEILVWYGMVKTKKIAQQITLKPNIIKVKKIISIIADVSLFTTSSEQSKWTYRVWYIYRVSQKKVSVFDLT